MDSIERAESNQEESRLDRMLTRKLQWDKARVSRSRSQRTRMGLLNEIKGNWVCN